jgi:hypothetical protein
MSVSGVCNYIASKLISVTCTEAYNTLKSARVSCSTIIKDAVGRTVN